MPANDFAKMIKDLSSLGDSVTITATKDGVRLTTAGEVGTANINIR